MMEMMALLESLFFRPLLIRIIEFPDSFDLRGKIEQGAPYVFTHIIAKPKNKNVCESTPVCRFPLPRAPPL